MEVKLMLRLIGIGLMIGGIVACGAVILLGNVLTSILM
jgi:hypothetical protein